ncbi:hypothetical protein RHGRI_007501 [Rhododendron griersonianum]|uniref:Glycine-rich protein n=1 Tax=Rhododendron griersonianum TaxID=479676 RepID=A0AAV6KX84_9ERIC|nr:hypothetical protein RHGRI_007501 [Rhododendron griersonianum]
MEDVRRSPFTAATWWWWFTIGPIPTRPTASVSRPRRDSRRLSSYPAGAGDSIGWAAGGEGGRAAGMGIRSETEMTKEREKGRGEGLLWSGGGRGNGFGGGGERGWGSSSPL